MKNLLVVDDEPEVVDGLVDILSELEDLHIHTASIAGEALRVMESATIDVIVADIHMPGMDGLELCETIQRKWPQTRIIFLSGVRDFDVIYRSISNPSVRYLTKMEPDSKIQQTVSEVLREMEEEAQQKHLRDIVLRTFPQSFLNDLTADSEGQVTIVDAVCDYIRNHLDRDLSLTALGKFAGFNPHYLSRVFKEQAGIGLSDYIMKIRMNTAHKLVLGSGKKIKDIASTVGYDSPHSFIRAYRKTFGFSPAEHRRIKQ